MSSRNDPLIANSQPTSSGAKDMVQRAVDGLEKRHENLGNKMSEDNITKTSIPTPLSQKDGTIKVSRRKFHLLYWLAAVPQESRHDNTLHEGVTTVPLNYKLESLEDSASFDVDLDRLADLTVQIELLIERHLEPGQRRAEHHPVECLLQSFKNVEAKLADIQQAQSAAADTPSTEYHSRAGRQCSPDYRVSRESPPSHRGRHISQGRENCQAVVSLAKQVYKFLLPLDYSPEKSSRYWGTIYWYLE
ncbi:MAG: hypothetical protein L6R40_006996, partial [Gallowayella cf. fulva]